MHGSSLQDRPVVILPGLNHWSFSSGPLPRNVAQHDLRPELSTALGHQQIATVVADYLASTLGHDAVAQQRMAREQERTALLLQPLLEALKMEGYHHFKPSCDSDYPTNPVCRYPKPLGACFGCFQGSNRLEKAGKGLTMDQIGR